RSSGIEQLELGFHAVSAASGWLDGSLHRGILLGCADWLRPIQSQCSFASGTHHLAERLSPLGGLELQCLFEPQLLRLLRARPLENRSQAHLELRPAL